MANLNNSDLLDTQIFQNGPVKMVMTLKRDPGASSGACVLFFFRDNQSGAQGGARLDAEDLDEALDSLQNVVDGAVRSRHIPKRAAPKRENWRKCVGFGAPPDGAPEQIALLVALLANGTVLVKMPLTGEQTETMAKTFTRFQQVAAGLKPGPTGVEPVGPLNL